MLANLLVVGTHKCALRRLHGATRHTPPMWCCRGVGGIHTSSLGPRQRGLAMRAVEQDAEKAAAAATTTTSSSSSSSRLPSSEELPPWPMDEVEYNTQMPKGGHDVRLQHQQQRDSSSRDDVRARMKEPEPLTDDARARVQQVEQSPEGQAALRVSGWVCGRCLMAMPHATRTICDGCHTLRHDLSLHSQAAAQRRDVRQWCCNSCGECTHVDEGSCRCCGEPRGEADPASPSLMNTSSSQQQQQPISSRERVADEVSASPLGAVIVVKNRILRWTCAHCREVNSLHTRRCRLCQRERFDLHLLCPSCRAEKHISNNIIYGEEHNRHGQDFGSDNCVGAHSGEVRCDFCQASMHGACVRSYPRDPWWCACGVVNHSTRASCARCRLPRTVGSPAVLQQLVGGGWDLRGCTNWFCEQCDGVNHASCHVVGLRGDGVRGGRPLGSKMEQPNKADVLPVKISQVRHGDGRCRHCHQPWHHQMLHDGSCWRCACHVVNETRHHNDRGKESVGGAGVQLEHCTSCGLPGTSTLSCSVISFWTWGDWLCPSCNSQNYRERVLCRCGQRRPSPAHSSSKPSAAPSYR